MRLVDVSDAARQVRTVVRRLHPIKVLLSFTVAAAIALVLAPAARAASATPGDFSSLVSPNPRIFPVADCRAEVGVVFDWTPYPGYHHIGGVRINCRRIHRVIAAAVALYYFDGSRWVRYGRAAVERMYGSAGSGPGISGILRTHRYCVGKDRAYYWTVEAGVRVDRNSRIIYSYAFRDAVGGC